MTIGYFAERLLSLHKNKYNNNNNKYKNNYIEKGIFKIYVHIHAIIFVPYRKGSLFAKFSFFILIIGYFPLYMLYHLHVMMRAKLNIHKK